MNRRELKKLGRLNITANAAQLSLRDLRMRPLRPLPEPPPDRLFDAPLEDALKRYVESLA